MNQENTTVEEQGHYQEEESDDGGVSLPSPNPGQLDLDHDVSTSSSSTSMLSELSLYSAQPSLNDSDTTDQHGLLGVFEGTSAPHLGDSSTSMPEHSSLVDENAVPHHEEASNEGLGHESMPAEVQISEPTTAPQFVVSNSLSNDPESSNALFHFPAPAVVFELSPENLPTPHPLAHGQAAPPSPNYQEHLPSTENYSCDGFMQLWKDLWLNRKSEYPSIIYDETKPDMNGRSKITTKTVATTSCDFQGISWSHYRTSKCIARAVRRMTARNFSHMHDINPEQPREAYATPAYKACFKSGSSPALSTTDDFFHFRETQLAMKPGHSHGQLRHCLCASSTNAVFYFDSAPLYSFPGLQALQVKCLTPATDTVSNTMNLRKGLDPEAPRFSRIACMTASDGLLIAGDLHEGHYAMKSLSSTCDDADIRGVVNEPGFGAAGINHIHTFLHRRNGLPHAVFCDNNGNIRVLNCSTIQWVHNQRWLSPVNCSATSPDGRLRIHVSDDPWPIVSDAETGANLARLPGHKDHGFACDWSPDGVTMATGHQDGIVQIWDARRMKEAVHALPAEMGGIRSLKFSPLGAGHPVLVMAEPMDFVSIVDARTFRSKQDIEFFGEISGITMPPAGGSLFIGNADLRRGGIYEFERTGYSGDFKHRSLRCSNLQQRKNAKRQAIYNITSEDSDCEDFVEEASTEATLKRKWKLDDHDATIWQTREHDWALEADFENDARAVLTKKQRWRRHLSLDEYVL